MIRRHISGKEALLLFIHLANEVRGRTRLQKEIFLCKEEKRAKIPYLFTPYSYGPFSFDLWNDLEELCNERLVSEDEIAFELVSGETGTQYVYRITDEGKKAVKHDIMPKVEPKLLRKMKETIEEYNQEDLATVLSNVYRYFSRTQEL